MSLRPTPLPALAIALGLIAPAAQSGPPADAAPAAAPAAAGEDDASRGSAGEPLGDILREIRVRVRALNNQWAAEAEALRRELAAARARIAALEVGRRVADAPGAAVTGESERSAADPAAMENPPAFTLLGLAAAMLLGFAAVGCWLWRLHRRMRRLVPEDLPERLVRVERAHGALLRLLSERADGRPPLRALEADRGRGGARKEAEG